MPDRAPRRPSWLPGWPHPARRWAAALGRFWFDFLVGDTPELVVGTALALGAGAGLTAIGARRAAAAVLPLLVLSVLVVSVARARRGSRPPSTTARPPATGPGGPNADRRP